MTANEKEGREIVMPVAIQGAIAWPTYLLLGMMQREWERPLHEDHWINEQADAPSQRGTIVLLFWTLFEMLMDRFFDAAMADFPDGAREDLLKRYGQVGSRLGKLYRIVFDTTFFDDLSSQGDEHIAAHLRDVQACRNAFLHGDPQALNELLICRTVVLLQDSQNAWIRLYNRRCTNRKRLVPVWDVRPRKSLQP